MFKFTKIAVLFIFVLSLIGCSNVPEGISKEQYEDGVEIAKIIDQNFENKSYLNDTEKVKVENYIANITNENFQPSSKEETLFVSEIKVMYMFYNYYLKYLAMDDVEQIDFNKQKYMDILENLKTKYKVEF